MVRKKLAELQPILANAAAGDFSRDLKIPEEEDEFTELFVGVQMMVEVIREQITELRKLDQKLEAKANERSAALEEAQALTHLGSWQWDVKTGVISWSDELYRVYGLKPQEREIGYEEFLLLIHPGDRDRVSSIIGRSFKTGKPFEFEHRIILPNKKQRILHGIGKIVTDAAGRPIKMVGTSQDITEHKKFELALQRSDRRFKTVMQATHDLIYDLDLASRTVWFSEALYDAYGYKKDRSHHTLDWCVSCVHPDDMQEIRDQIGKLIASKQQSWQTEHRFQKADKSYTVVRNRGYILYGASGKPERIIGSLLDITAQKQLEHAKDEFLSLVSHQLRTPLTVTRLFSEMLSQGVAGKLTPQQEDYVSRITGASIRMIKLVSEILNISRIELGRIKVQPEPTDINALVASHLKELQPLAEEKDTALKFTPKSKLPRVPIDTDVFNLIFENLLANAIRYTEPGKGCVQIEFTKTKDGFILKVRDNGIGIPTAARPHVFNRFYRADNAVSFDSEGTGIGLYLVKLISDVIGADIWFEGQKNSGTAFYLKLPLRGMAAKEGEAKLE